MKRLLDPLWIGQMAEGLICEIMTEMSGIGLRGAEEPHPAHRIEDMAAIFGETIGDYHIKMQLKCDYPLLVRLAGNMLGEAPEDQEEVEEYAMEFFNIVCGRFVSELYISTQRSARFQPAVYEHPPHITALGNGEPVNTIYFISDQSEAAIFSWVVVDRADF